MNRRAIEIVAVGDRYQPYADRLIASLPSGAHVYRHRGWPPFSPTHAENHYAFKYYAVMHALRHGYDYALYLDSACYRVGDLAPIWDTIQARGVYLIHGLEPLGKWISDQALDHFGISRDQVFDQNIPLCGGAIVGLDLKNPLAHQFLAQWKLLVKKGLLICSHTKLLPDRMTSLIVSDHDEDKVISEDSRCKGHLSDEACFSLIARKLQIETTPLLEFNQTFASGYNL